MSNLPIFELFLGVGNLKPKTQVIFKAKISSIELGSQCLGKSEDRLANFLGADTVKIASQLSKDRLVFVYKVAKWR